MPDYTAYIVIDVTMRTFTNKHQRISAVPVGISCTNTESPINIPWDKKVSVGEYIYKNNETHEFISKAQYIQNQEGKCARVLSANIIITPSATDIYEHKKDAYALKRILAFGPYTNGDFCIDLKCYPYDPERSDKYFETNTGNEIIVKPVPESTESSNICHTWEIVKNITMAGARSAYCKERTGK